jgi:agmatinase
VSRGPVPAAFLGAGPRAGARWALFGAPLDATVTFRPGCRFGPGAVRSASAVLEDWSPALGVGLGERPFCDLGDLEPVPGDVEGTLEAIRELVGQLAEEGLRPLMLGGEHLVTWPAVAALAARHPGLRVLQFDAHADLREEYLGRRASHATVMRRVAEVVGPGHCYQVGIRSGTAEEWAFARTSGIRFAPGAAGLPAGWREELSAGPVYVTVDIDFVDPAYAPGTGTPEPGGATAAELLAAIDGLRGLDLVGADVVEVAPAYDPGGITAALAAKVVRELLLLP